MQLLAAGAIVAAAFFLIMLITRATEGSWRGSHSLKTMWRSPWALTSIIAPTMAGFGLLLVVAGLVAVVSGH